MFYALYYWFVEIEFGTFEGWQFACGFAISMPPGMWTQHCTRKADILFLALGRWIFFFCFSLTFFHFDVPFFGLGILVLKIPQTKASA